MSMKYNSNENNNNWMYVQNNKQKSKCDIQLRTKTTELQYPDLGQTYTEYGGLNMIWGPNHFNRIGQWCNSTTQ